jgi:DNA-binding transcriptional MerR regulator
MRIGELAARFGLAPHVLRHWEEMGLLTPAARVSGRREYDESHVGRVVMIQRAKAAGLSLEQIRRMFDAPGGAERRAVLAEQDTRLDELIRQAQESKRLIEHALSCAEPEFTRCPLFHQLVEELSNG